MSVTVNLNQFFSDIPHLQNSNPMLIAGKLISLLFRFVALILNFKNIEQSKQKKRGLVRRLMKKIVLEILEGKEDVFTYFVG